MKTKFTLAVFACTGLFIGLDFLFNSSASNVSGAPAGHTGSPADGHNCTFCHSGSATTQNGLITSNIPIFGYIPGQTYTVTATLSGAANRYGFQISPQNSAGTRIGTMSTGGSNQMQLISSGKYLTHTQAGTTGSGGSKTWTFTWTAPATNQGPFTFYGAFNLANGNNNTTGDAIQLSTLPVTPDPTAGVEEASIAAQIGLYPSPASDVLHISAPQKVEAIRIYDLKGGLIKEFAEASETLDVSDLHPGLYFIHLELDQNTVSKKFFKL